MHQLTFKLAPRPYCRPRFSRNGRTYNLKAYTDYKLAIEFLAINQFKLPPLQGALHVDLVFSLKRPKKTTHSYPSRADLDNYCKGVCDSLNEVLWEDDRQIVSMNACKAWANEDSIIIEVFSADEMLKGHC